MLEKWEEKKKKKNFSKDKYKFLPLWQNNIWQMNKLVN